jgi:hypothetical protein
MKTPNILLNVARIIVSGWGVNAAAQELAADLTGDEPEAMRRSNPTHLAARSTSTREASMSTGNILIGRTGPIAATSPLHGAAREFAHEIMHGLANSDTRLDNPKWHHRNEREERLKHSVKLVISRVTARSLTPLQRIVAEKRAHDLRWYVRDALTGVAKQVRDDLVRRENPLGVPVRGNVSETREGRAIRIVMERMRERRMSHTLREVFSSRSADLFRYIEKQVVKGYKVIDTERAKREKASKSKQKDAEAEPASGKSDAVQVATPIAPAPVAPAPVAPAPVAPAPAQATHRIIVPDMIAGELDRRLDNWIENEDGDFHADQQQAAKAWQDALTKTQSGDRQVDVTAEMLDFMLDDEGGGTILEDIFLQNTNEGNVAIEPEVTERMKREHAQLIKALKSMKRESRTNKQTVTPRSAPVAPAPVAPAAPQMGEATETVFRKLIAMPVSNVDNSINDLVLAYAALTDAIRGADGWRNDVALFNKACEIEPVSANSVTVREEFAGFWSSIMMETSASLPFFSPENLKASPSEETPRLRLDTLQQLDSAQWLSGKDSISVEFDEARAKAGWQLLWRKWQANANTVLIPNSFRPDPLKSYGKNWYFALAGSTKAEGNFHDLCRVMNVAAINVGTRMPSDWIDEIQCRLSPVFYALSYLMPLLTGTIYHKVLHHSVVHKRRFLFWQYRLGVLSSLFASVSRNKMEPLGYWEYQDGWLRQDEEQTTEKPVAPDPTQTSPVRKMPAPTASIA